MDNKKEMERAELHRAIWQIANDLRGSVDGWDFKQYVLGTLFYRYISEKLTNYLNREAHEAGDAAFDYAALSDEEAETERDNLVEEQGYFILPSELFANVRKAAPTNENLNETLEKVFHNIEASATGTASENDLAGLFEDLDVNSNKLGATVKERNAKLMKLLDGIGEMQLGDYRDNTIDAFGDAYEYLMRMYASNAGKSGGEYYTPQEVSELLTRLTVIGKARVNKVYDPACGSGSLLLKFAKILGKENVRNGFYGQEINITTYNLCRINMFLHDINFDDFDIARGDTLTDPQHDAFEPFEAIVSNPPYSIRWAGKENPLLINDPRFAPAGVLAPPSKAARLAGSERYGSDRLLPRHHVSRRRGEEDSPVFDRQQFRRCRDPAAGQSLLRHEHRDLHHGAEEVESGHDYALHRRFEGMHQGHEQQQAHAGKYRAYPADVY